MGIRKLKGNTAESKNKKLKFLDKKIIFDYFNNHMENDFIDSDEYDSSNLNNAYFYKYGETSVLTKLKEYYIKTTFEELNKKLAEATEPSYKIELINSQKRLEGQALSNRIFPSNYNFGDILVNSFGDKLYTNKWRLSILTYLNRVEKDKQLIYEKAVSYYDKHKKQKDKNIDNLLDFMEKCRHIRILKCIKNELEFDHFEKVRIDDNGNSAGVIMRYKEFTFFFEYNAYLLDLSSKRAVEKFRLSFLNSLYRYACNEREPIDIELQKILLELVKNNKIRPNRYGDMVPAYISYYNNIKRQSFERALDGKILDEYKAICMFFSMKKAGEGINE